MHRPIHPRQTVSTEAFWQRTGITTEGATPRNSIAVTLPDGAVLQLPVRRLADDPRRGVASLISNQTSFAVEEIISSHMASVAQTLGPEVIVGMPTLGLVYAASVARKLGHANFVPLGYSRKFWYDDALCEPVRSLTTPDQAKVVFLDPNLVSRLDGRRVLVIDDVISSGSTAVAVLKLLQRVSIEPIGALVAMVQGELWRQAMDAYRPGWSERVHAVMSSPILIEGEDGWNPA